MQQRRQGSAARALRAVPQCRLRHLLGRRARHGPRRRRPGTGLDRAGPAGRRSPLSAAATRDALERLQALRRAPPAATDTAITDVAPTAPLPGRLRVALGPPVNGYVGATIALARPGGKAPAAHARAGTRHAFTLLLVETVAAGAEGNAAERHIVRNALQGTWETGTAGPRAGWSELRPMRIPDGADAGRLGAVGWLQDTDGTVVAAARAHCPAADASRPQ